MTLATLTDALTFTVRLDPFSIALGGVVALAGLFIMAAIVGARQAAKGKAGKP